MSGVQGDNVSRAANPLPGSSTQSSALSDARPDPTTNPIPGSSTQSSALSDARPTSTTNPRPTTTTNPIPAPTTNPVPGSNIQPTNPMPGSNTQPTFLGLQLLHPKRPHDNKFDYPRE
jgi:hypothetical protein